MYRVIHPINGDGEREPLFTVVCRGKWTNDNAYANLAPCAFLWRKSFKNDVVPENGWLQNENSFVTLR